MGIAEFKKDYLFDFKENVNLSEFSYYKIGGRADLFVRPKNTKEIIECIKACNKNKIKYFITGSTTNLLFKDSGFNGCIIYLSQNKDMNLEVVQEDDLSKTLKVPSFFMKAHLLEYSLKNSLSGLEFSAGIPGTLGGAVYMNAGTKWGSYSEVITEVELYHPQKGILKISNKDLGLSYRSHDTQVFKEGAVVLSVYLRLKKNIPTEEIQSKVDEILKYRGQKQPLELPNCGSVFKNPENSIKGSGRLIEASKLKGKQIGGAQVSLKHANFIINTGNATSDDVKDIISLCQKTVKNRHNVDLETELIFVD